MKTTLIGLDLAKNVFHLMRLDGTTRKLKRPKVLEYFARLEPSTIAMEACGSAHYWGRRFQAMGHQVVLLPPQHVKGYLRGQKNDFNDARAILEAAQHGRIRPVAVKSAEQQARQALVRVRQLHLSERTRLANQVRGLLYEYGLVVARGVNSLRQRLPELLEAQEADLPPLIRQLLTTQYRRLVALDEEIAALDKQTKRQVNQDKDCRRLTQLPGFGPIVSYAFHSWIGDGLQFNRGRDASAALGIVPRQHSSGDKAVLMGITKRGDAHLRSLVIHGARSVVSRAGTKTDRLSQWINRLVATRGFNKAVVALANKLVRMAWVLITRRVDYQPQVV